MTRSDGGVRGGDNADGVLPRMMPRSGDRDDMPGGGRSDPHPDGTSLAFQDALCPSPTPFLIHPYLLMAVLPLPCATRSGPSTLDQHAM